METATAAQPGSRPPLKAADTLDLAPQLSGQLSHEGIAELDSDAWSRQSSTNNIPKLNGSATMTGDSSSSRQSSPDEETEDYDALKPDQDAIMHGSQGGDLDIDAETVQDSTARDSTRRRRSIPIRLEKTDKRGRYKLHADDLEIREIIRASVERQRMAQSNSKRIGIRELVFTRRFSTFDRQNVRASDSPFHGFFTLFWLAILLMLLRVAAYNYKQSGSVLGGNEVLKMMFSRDLVILALTDIVLCGSTLFGFALQHLILRSYLDWGKSGYVIEHIWQTFYISGFIGWTFYREWPWTHTIFIVLHTFVFLMKQHSYSFYNGYRKSKCRELLRRASYSRRLAVSQLYHRKQLLSRKLKHLKHMTPISSPTNPSSPLGVSASSPDLVDELRPTSPRSPNRDASHSLRRRRKSAQQPVSSLRDPDDITNVASQISSDQPLTSDQMNTFSDLLSSEIEFLNSELRGKCSTTNNHYPHNLTLFNFAEWTCLPTLVYELEYPRQPSINWLYVLEKATATLGVIAVMMAISQAYIYPPVAETVRMKEAGMTVSERWQHFPWIVSDMLFPLLLEQLLTWYVM